ncbi:MAG: T9SS type A sorting domain-containing protein [Flavobacteriia bacterium]|nr:T9SS type A sorting domain-containing protein [Flavobacteriia bacterium]
MKKIISIIKFISFLIIYLIWCSDSFSQLNGTKTIGGQNPDYQTINDAVQDLVSEGVNGTTIFNIRNGIYYENIVVPQVNGVSSTKKIIFQSEAFDSSSVTICGDSNVIIENNSKFISFKYLTVSSISNNSIALMQLNEISDCLIDHCNFVQQVGSIIGIQAYSQNNIFKNITISNSSFNTDFGFKSINNQIENLNLLNNFYDVLMEANSIMVDSTFSLFNCTSLNIVNAQKGIEVISNSGLLIDFSITNSIFNVRELGIKIFSTKKTENIVIDNVDILGLSSNNVSVNDGIIIEGVEQYLKNITISNMKIENISGNGIYIHSSYILTKIKLLNLDINTINSGVFVLGDQVEINDISLKNTLIISNEDIAFKIAGAKGINNVLFQNDTLKSVNGALGLFALNGSISNCNIDSSFFSTIDSSICCAEGITFSNYESNISNIFCSNSIIKGNVGLSINSYLGIDSVILSNNRINSYNEALLIKNNYDQIRSITILNSYFNSLNSSAFFISATNSNTSSLSLINNRFYGVDGVNIKSTVGLDNSFVKNCDIVGYTSSGIKYYGVYGGVSNFDISDSHVKGFISGIQIVQNNQDISTVKVENNLIETFESNLNGIGVSIKSDFAAINHLLIQKNSIIAGNIGMYLNGAGLGTNSANVLQNSIRLSDITGTGFGIKIEKIGNNSHISDNSIDTINGGDVFSEGIYIDGIDLSVDSLFVENNRINNAQNIGIHVESITGSLILNKNQIKSNFMNGSMTGILTYNVNNLLVSNNENYANNELKAFELYNITSGSIYNNFCSGYSQSFYSNNCNNLYVYNNTFNNKLNNSSISNVEIDNNSANIHFINNIFNLNDSTFVGNIFSIENLTSLGTCLNNVYELDTTISNFLHVSNLSLSFNSLFSWQLFSNKENNSFLYDVMFMDEFSDLHVFCTETILNNGSNLLGINFDIDNNERAVFPTIGADEMIRNNKIFNEDTIITCHLPITLYAGSSINDIYYWSTGETEQMITIDSFGLYEVNIITDCGSFYDTVLVQICDDLVEIEDDFILYENILYPNPTSTVVNFNLKKEDDLFISIYDLSGNLVLKDFLESNINQINISPILPGLYIVKIKSKQKEIIQRLIIQ